MRILPALALPVLAGCATAEADGRNGEKPIAVITDPFRAATAGFGVTLDASDSYDPDNAAPAFPHGIESFNWSLASIPAGSNAVMTFGSGSASFVADATGDFAGELVVTDLDGNESEPAPFSIIVEPIDPELAGVFVSVAWENDGRDLDLHLSLNGAAFKDPTFDCHYANQNPDWGVVGNDQDPTLVQDFSAGPGPEVIRVQEPQQATYTVFVHYYSDDGLGATNPMLTIAHNGALVAAEQGSLQMTGKVWTAGTIAFSSSNAAPTFTPDGTIFDPPI